MSERTPAEGIRAVGLSCTVNGVPAELDVAPNKRLLHILRDDLDLTGTKRSCEIGRCGACMVLVDGKPVNSCLTMAYQCDGRSVTTIEGIADADRLDPIQQAFLEEGGYQCGYCTPGMVISVKGLLSVTLDPTDEEIEEALSGNLCRCTGYGGILRSVKNVIAKYKEGY
ncbi:carbon-monoxide dehydrogenase small subunit [Paenibacillus phyllosphaerae]|uniref:Carbon-monoxide dehydrogenase small subunit n=1 Tax=Paenibacillus phyllosphaerae TaxID=274593 RepID=A0A7W5AZD9_9BACL|nr:(2Fe-2S)-binding protein [Paenibacillus phyllosphaerae]MBB3111264.1 carbon-monoxide dehydrogenase small subunit [Paenibacillus phyllosphaerae]